MSRVRLWFTRLSEWIGHALTWRELVTVLSGVLGLLGIARALWDWWLALDVAPQVLIGTGFLGLSVVVASGLWSIGLRFYDRVVRLDVHVNDFTAALRDSEESKKYFREDDVLKCTALTLLGIEITNRSSQNMSLDGTVRLALKNKSALGERFIDARTALLHGRAAEIYQSCPIPVPGHQTVEVRLVFAIWETDMMIIGGPQAIEEGGVHRLTLMDRVSSRKREVPFRMLA